MKILLVFITYYISFACSEEEIFIDLINYNPHSQNTNVLKRYFNLTENRARINISNIKNDVGFFVIQAHTYIENVTLTKDIKKSFGNSVTGTNVGLVWQNETSVFYILRNNKVDKYVRLLLVITVYDRNDPMPGGCNLSFDTNIAPYQITEYNDHTITVKSQPPSVTALECDDKIVQVDMYHLFLKEYDNSIDSYFNSIEKMLTAGDIKKYGTLVPNINVALKYKRMFSSYRGTGEVFAIISTYNNRISVYVPAVSYGCNLMQWEDSCLSPVEVHWKFFCACLLIFGLFICFFGHRFFKLTLYIVSFTFGLLVTYFVISIEDRYSFTERTITAFTVGFIYGIIWLIFWRRFGIPILTVTLALLTAGFLFASVLFNTVLEDLYIFTNSINFWISFSSAIILFTIIFIPIIMYGHIISISFLGAYGCVSALNFYVGGNIPYIMINTYRRFAVKDFNTAVIDPPMQMLDVVHILLWILLVLFGIMIQLRHQRGKPPFPPNRRVPLRPVISERTPLIYHDIFAPPPSYTP